MSYSTISAACWHVTRLGSRLLDPDEQNAVLGDLTESGASGAAALWNVCGLVLRRQAALWKTWQPWLALIGIVGVAGSILSEIFSQFALNLDLQMRTYWHYGVHYQHGIPAQEELICLTSVALALLLWSWTSGFVLGSLAGRGVWLTGILFYIVVIFSYEARQIYSGTIRFSRLSSPAVAISLSLLPLSLPKIAFALTLLWGVKQGFRKRSLALSSAVLLAASALVLILLVTWSDGWREAAQEFWSGGRWRIIPWPGRLMPLAVVSWPVGYLLVRSWRGPRVGKIGIAIACGALLLSTSQRSVAFEHALVNDKDRKGAPDFTLLDTRGKMVTLSAFKGKVVLLDFWATTCGGCKVEIPWYIDFYRKYRREGLAVLGVAMDDDGMKVVQPFIARNKIPYTIVSTTEEVTRRYEVTSMPMTLLIDRQGRVAVAHVGIVDKESFENEIRKLLQ